MRFQHGECKPELKRCGRLLSIGLPMALQFSITAIGSIVLQSAVNTLGSTYVAAVAAGAKLFQLLACPYDAMGAAMATYCGQNLGAGKHDRIFRGMKDAFYLCFFAAGAAAEGSPLLLRNLRQLFRFRKVDGEGLIDKHG